jgi:hypothetical protein
VCGARQHLCDCRLPNAEACLLSMSEFLNSDPHRTVDPLPFFYSLSLSRSPAPLSGVPAQRPSFAPTAFRPPCTGVAALAPMFVTSEAMWSGSDYPQLSPPPPPQSLALETHWRARAVLSIASSAAGTRRTRSCSPTALPSPRQADNFFFLLDLCPPPRGSYHDKCSSQRTTCSSQRTTKKSGTNIFFWKKSFGPKLFGSS